MNSNNKETFLIHAAKLSIKFLKKFYVLERLLGLIKLILNSI